MQLGRVLRASPGRGLPAFLPFPAHHVTGSGSVQLAVDRNLISPSLISDTKQIEMELLMFSSPRGCGNEAPHSSRSALHAVACVRGTPGGLCCVQPVHLNLVAAPCGAVSLPEDHRPGEGETGLSVVLCRMQGSKRGHSCHFLLSCHLKKGNRVPEGQPCSRSPSVWRPSPSQCHVHMSHPVRFLIFCNVLHTTHSFPLVPSPLKART